MTGENEREPRHPREGGDPVFWLRTTRINVSPKPQSAFCAQIKNSRLPSPPVMALGKYPLTVNPSESQQRRRLCSTPSYNCSSRTMPPFPIPVWPTSNCGLTILNTYPPSFSRETRPGSINVGEIKET